MYVCICHAVTDGQIRECVNNSGPCKMRELRAQLGVASRCGKCAAHALDVLREATASLQDASGAAAPNCC